MTAQKDLQEIFFAENGCYYVSSCSVRLYVRLSFIATVQPFAATSRTHLRVELPGISNFKYGNGSTVYTSVCPSIRPYVRHIQFFVHTLHVFALIAFFYLQDILNSS